MNIKQKLKRGILLLTGIVICTGFSAGAAYIDSADLKFSENKVCLNAKFLDNKDGEDVTILVIKPDGDIDNLVATKVEKQSQLKVSDGKFSLEFELNNPENGLYTVYINVGDMKKITSFRYDEWLEMTYSMIMRAQDSEIFNKMISEFSEELIIHDSVYSRISDKEKVASVVYGLKDSIESAEDLKNTIKAVSYIQALNESKLSEVVDNNRFIPEEILGLDTIDSEYGVNAYELYKNSVSETGIAKILAELQGNDYNSIDEFKKDFIYQCTIAGIKNNKNSGTVHISSILNKNNSVNKFNLTNYNKVSGNAINLRLLNGNEWEKNDIQKVLDTVFNNSGSGTGSGGGSTGGGSTGGSGVSSIGTSGGKNSGGYSQSYAVTENAETPGNEASVFNDIADVEWAMEAIENLSQKGIINGKAEGIFAPNDNVTRAEFLKMIIAAFGMEDENADCDFTDVEADAWYYSVVASAYNIGIVKGYEDGSFGVNDLITRQDAAVIIFRAVAAAEKLIPDNGGNIVFSDSEQISDYAVDSVNNLVKAKVLQGSDGNFMPKKNCTRAEAAVMVSKIMTIE